jgi:hypothetical protein
LRILPRSKQQMAKMARARGQMSKASWRRMCQTRYLLQANQRSSSTTAQQGGTSGGAKAVDPPENFSPMTFEFWFRTIVPVRIVVALFVDPQGPFLIHVC